MAVRMTQAEAQEIAALMDQVKDGLARLARAVYDAQEDGSISWFEALMLTTTATTTVLPIVTAFQGLSHSSVSKLISALENSDIVIK